VDKAIALIDKGCPADAVVGKNINVRSLEIFFF